MNEIRKVQSRAEKLVLTPRVPRVPFRDVEILTSFFAYSRYSEMLDQKWLLS